MPTPEEVALARTALGYPPQQVAEPNSSVDPYVGGMSSAPAPVVADYAPQLTPAALATQTTPSPLAALAGPDPRDAIATQVRHGEVRFNPATGQTATTAVEAPAPAPAPAPVAQPQAPRYQGSRTSPASSFQQFLASEYGRPETTQHRPGEPYSPADRSFGAQDDAAQYANLEAAEAAEMQEREAKRKATADAVEEQERIDMEMAQRRTARLRALEAKEARFASMADEIAAAPIDSKRLWNNASTGDKVMSVIGLLLAGAAGGPEGAKWGLEKIDRDIERDIDEQKSNKALQQSRLAAEGTLYDMARGRFESDGEMDAAMREGAYRRVQAQLEHMSDVAQDPVRRAQYQQLWDHTDAQVQEAQRQRRLASDQYELQLQAARARAGGAGASSVERRIKELGQQVKIKELGEKLSGSGGDAKLKVGGFSAPAYSSESATAMRNVVTASAGIRSALGELEKLTERGSGTTGLFGVGTDDYKRAQKLIAADVVPQLASTLARGFNPSVQQDESAKDLAAGLLSKSKSTRDATRRALLGSSKSAYEAAAEGHIQGYQRPPEPKTKGR